MNLLAVTSVSSRRRIERARAWLEARERDEELVIVGATVGAANELARQVASRNGGAAFGWHRIGLPQLVSIVAAQELTRSGVVSLTRIGADAVIMRLIHRLRVDRRLGRYSPVSETPGFPRAIAGVIAELRSAGVRSNGIEAVVPDLAPIVRAYERELAEGGFIDWSGTFEIAASAIAGPDRHRLVGLPLLMLDVPVRTEAEFGFVSAFVSAAQETLATVPASDSETLHRFRDRLRFEIGDLDSPNTFRWARYPMRSRANLPRRRPGVICGSHLTPSPLRARPSPAQASLRRCKRRVRPSLGLRMGLYERGISGRRGDGNGCSWKPQ